MIVEIIFYIIGVVVSFFGQFLPGYGVYPLLLPWGLDSLLINGFAGYKIIMNSFPPLKVALDVFLIYIGFKLVLQLLKAIPVLGRTIRDH